MTNINCGCKTSCIGLSVVASIIIGIITSFLIYTATVALTPAFLWVLLGIAVVWLAVLLITVATTRVRGIRDCLCPILPVLFTGILGTIITAIVLLAITFAATSVIGAIIAGLLLLFFALTITSTTCLIKCIAGCDEE